MREVWEWPRAVVVAHYDGDTFYADVDLGAELIRKRLPIRIFGIDTPELRPLQPGALEAKAKLIELIPIGTVVSLTSVGYDKYGPRVDAVVTRKADGLVVSDALVDAGVAVWRTY